MSILQQQYYGNSVQAWLIAGAIAAACFLALKAVQWIITHRLATYAKRTATDVDDIIVEALRKTKSLFVIVVSLYVGLHALALSPEVEHFIRIVLIVTSLVQGGIWIGAAVSCWFNTTIKRKMEKDAASATTLTALGVIVRIVLWSIVLLVALANVGIDITALVAGLGIGGIAVALTLQNILTDLFSSLSIVLDKPFIIGDFIIVDDYMGSVEHIGLKTTRLRSLSGEQIIFSNGDLLKSRLRNYKRMFERRVVFTIGITYDTPHQKLTLVSKILREIIESQQRIRFDRAHFKEFKESALVYEAVYFVLSPDYNLYMDIQQAINVALYQRLADEKIEFAHPVRSVNLNLKGSDTDGLAEHNKTQLLHSKRES